MWAHTLERLQEAAPSLGLTLESVAARGSDELDAALAAATGAGAAAVFVVYDGLFTTHRQRIADLAASRRLPIIAGDRALVEAGGLMSYGVHFPAMLRRLAQYVDRIVKGAKPHDLAIEQATTFELSINLKTARTLGLTVPRAVLLRANHVIE